MNSQLLQEQISRFPESPGVYLMKDAQDTIIYIGKAINLKSRVRSYFNNTHDGRPQIPIMMSQLSHIELIVTESETEALLLEAELVRKHLPKYNVELRDDKRYPYLKITTSETFPRLLIVRRVGDDAKKGTAKYFGPFVDVTTMRRVADFARRIFKIRTCTKKLPLKNVTRPCINCSMKRCGGPCAVSADSDKYNDTVENYKRSISDLTIFLKGRRKDLIKILEERMSAAASKLLFEEAAIYRNQIRMLKTSLRIHRPDLKISGAEEKAQMYFSQITPVEITPADLKILQELQSVLNLPVLPRVIEAFDISNLGATFTVAAMVRCSDAQLDKSAYRKYKIKTVEGQNDFAMMMEVVSRRLTRLANEGQPFPDLLLIDGGKGQLNSAIAVLKNFESPPQIISIAKKEELIFSPCMDEPLALPQTHAARRLIERIRNEVHRFVITYHRKIRGKQFKGSLLENLPGVGKAKATLLLKHFGSVKRLKEATIDEVAKVRGFTEETAAKLLSAL